MILAWLVALVCAWLAVTRGLGGAGRACKHVPLRRTPAAWFTRTAARKAGSFPGRVVLRHFPSPVGPPFHRPLWAAACPIRGGPV